MRDERISGCIAQTMTAGARPDFADLLRRIEADNGASTVPQLTASRRVAASAAAYTAAGIAAAAALGTMTFIGLSMGGAKNESAAMDCEAPAASESFSSSWIENEREDSLQALAPSEPTADKEPVSDSDVSDSDVSDSDTHGDG